MSGTRTFENRNCDEELSIFYFEVILHNFDAKRVRKKCSVQDYCKHADADTAFLSEK